MLKSVGLVATLALMTAAPLVAIAASTGHVGHGAVDQAGHDFHGRSFHSFNDVERHEWQGGHWEHAFHHGRFAWWWVVGIGWYFYPEPIYPYPVYVPPTVVDEIVPPVPTGAPPVSTWYYCDDPQGYYPYVASCKGPWHAVPVEPAPAEPAK
jgi:hypothetical protein